MTKRVLLQYLLPYLSETWWDKWTWYGRRKYALNYLHISVSVTALAYYITIVLYGEIAVRCVKAQYLEKLIAKYDESCSISLLCQTVCQTLFLLHFHFFFKHELLSLNAIFFLHRKWVKNQIFYYNLLTKDQTSVKAYTIYFI